MVYLWKTGGALVSLPRDEAASLRSAELVRRPFPHELYSRNGCLHMSISIIGGRPPCRKVEMRF